jgi:hypothetical protein
MIQIEERSMCDGDQYCTIDDCPQTPSREQSIAWQET